ncbi:putative uncharacterized protein [Bacteroides uniformis CAG:3]|nr:putative uncharacterized protein [Bacteroides uniformis CAG:3]
MYIMKKNILYSLLISTVATVGLSSCDAFLEENPKDQITEEQAYQNSTLLYLNTVASLYTQVGANGGGSGLQGTDRGLYDLNTFTTDEAVLPTRGGGWDGGGVSLHVVVTGMMEGCGRMYSFINGERRTTW